MIMIGASRFQNREFGNLFSKEIKESVQPELKINTNDKALADSFSRLALSKETCAHVIKNDGVYLLSRLINLLQAELGIRLSKEELLDRLFDDEYDYYVYFQAITLSLRFRIVKGSSNKDLVDKNEQANIVISTMDSEHDYEISMPKFAFESLISMAAAKYTVAEYPAIRSDIIQSTDTCFPAVDEDERRDILTKLLWLSTLNQRDRSLLDTFINVEAMTGIAFKIDKNADDLLTIRVIEASSL